jgi:hypothetical protein
MSDELPHLEQTITSPVDPEARLWAAFATAGSTEAVCRSWLALQCRSMPGAGGGMVLLARPGGPFQPVAVWPDASQDFSFLRAIAEECVKTGSPVVHRPPHDSGATGLHVAYPFLADADHPVGAVVLDLVPRSEAEIKVALRGLHWGVGWLEAQAVRDQVGREKQRVTAAVAALDIVAVANEYDRVEQAAMAIANEMATRLGAARVAIGLNGKRGIRLMALSHTAWFNRKTTMVTGFEQAMDEAAEQRATIRSQPAPGEVVRIQVAHEALAAHWDGDAAFTTFPLLTERGPAGAITVLYDAPPADAVVRLGEAICALLGPMLDHKRRARRLVSGRVVDSLHDAFALVVGPRHIGWKLLAFGVTCAVAASVLIPTQFRVSAKAVLEGRVQRTIPAPFDSFIATAPAKAGDIVHAGDLLATLDDRDLQLDRVRWQGEHDRLILKSREALSKHDPGTSAQLDAELAETDAQAALTAEKLARTRIVAPIDGIVVSGDLSQSIGAPVETGKVLFEVAPLDNYRVLVRLSENDIRYVKPGQTGHLLLQGMTGDSLDFDVRGVTSVAETDAGENTFRVEGTLENAPPNLRPGMEGIGKIDIDDHSYAWVWTRGVRNWAWMVVWRLTP